MANTKLCEWCSTEIQTSSLKCPNCQSWRKDIHNDRIIFYSTSIFGGLILGWGLGSGSWSTFMQSFSFGAFFLTFSGWAAIFFLVVSHYFYVRVSKKIGTWWWF